MDTPELNKYEINSSPNDSNSNNNNDNNNLSCFADIRITGGIA